MMHGLVNRTIEVFVRSTYGDEMWHKVALAAKVDPEGFLTWSPSTEAVTFAIVDTASGLLEKTNHEFLEDVGAWLARLEQIRRLMRFSGSTYEEFLESLREMSGRIILVFPDMVVPILSIVSVGEGEYNLTTSKTRWGLLRLLAGLLRGMADDYGALATISVNDDMIVIRVALLNYSDERSFSLYQGE